MPKGLVDFNNDGAYAKNTDKFQKKHTANIRHLTTVGPYLCDKTNAHTYHRHTVLQRGTH